ncbi:MAG: hypothetical protein ACF788_04255, partial [Novipirellula sp. JB048]
MTRWVIGLSALFLLAFAAAYWSGVMGQQGQPEQHAQQDPPAKPARGAEQSADANSVQVGGVRRPADEVTPGNANRAAGSDEGDSDDLF